jgi:hypothetical protein
MNWFYAKDGQQVGPVAFSEIERLYSEGQLRGDTLVWQQGMPSWVELSTLLQTRRGVPSAPTTPTSIPTTQPAVLPGQSTTAPLPDYGDLYAGEF